MKTLRLPCLHESLLLESPHGPGNKRNAYSDPLAPVHLLYYLEYLCINFFHIFLWKAT